MIRLCFFERNGALCGFECEGHSGYGEKGSDIVCAAVSAMVALAESAINDIAKAGAAVTVEEEKARIRLLLPEELPEKAKTVSESVLLAMFGTASGYTAEYGEYLSVVKREIKRQKS
jgi:uncharacterized protein YsxB (DUF464 family)